MIDRDTLIIELLRWSIPKHFEDMRGYAPEGHNFFKEVKK